MARTKTTRRTYTNKKLKTIGNVKEAENARIEAPFQDVGLSKPQAGCLSNTEKRSDLVMDSVSVVDEIGPKEPLQGVGLSQPQAGCLYITEKCSDVLTEAELVSEEIETQMSLQSPVLGRSQRSVNGHTTSTPIGPTADNHADGATRVSPSAPGEQGLPFDSSMEENSQLQANFRPITPDMSNIPLDEIFSPKTQNELRSTIRALFPNGPPPPPPVKPIRRPKKGDKPYIVGCTMRRRVPSPKCLSVFQGDDYGITDKTNCDEDEQCSPVKRGRRGPKGSGNLSKSRFNPLSDEIAERLKLNEKIDRLLGRTPKEETVGYMTKPNTSRTFSPIPSTSTDSETIMKNDKHFSESLICDNDNFDIDDDDELPEIVWESSKRQQERTDRYDAPLALIKKETIDLKIETDVNKVNDKSLTVMENDDDLPEIVWKSSKCKQEKTDRNDSPLDLIKKKSTDLKIETDVNKDYDKSLILIENDIDDTPVVLNEDLNNNNDVIVIDNDYCEIDFDKLLPKERLIITEEEINAKSILNDTSRVIPSTCSSDVVWVGNESNVSTNGDVINTSASQGSRSQVNSTVLRASNRMPTAGTPDLVIDVLSSTENRSSPASANRLPIPISFNDVQFVSETRSNEPRPQSEKSENYDVQIIGTSQSVNTLRQRNDYLLAELQHFFSLVDSAVMGRQRKPAKRKSKRQKPCHTAVVNNENTAPTVNQMPTPVNVTQPDASSVAGSPPTGKKLGDCPICLDSLSSGSIASTNCGHVFCLDCIKRSLSTSGKRCPTCRKQLKGAGYHQVFL